MKVGFIGNRDQEYFGVVRNLRRCGFDAHLFLLEDEPLADHPSQLAIDRSYQAFTHSLPWGTPMRLTRTPRSAIATPIQRVLGRGPIFARGAAPAFLARAGIPIFAVAPFGDDVSEFARIRAVVPRRGAWLTPVALPHYQRRGLRHAAWLMGPQTLRSDALYTNAKCTGQRVHTALPTLDESLLGRGRIHGFFERSNWFSDLCAIRNKSDIFVLCADASQGDATRTVLAGFARLVRSLEQARSSSLRLPTRHASPATLVVSGHGNVNQPLAQLARDLGIAASIEWFPPLAPKDLLVACSFADSVVAARPESFFSGARACLYAFAAEAPLFLVAPCNRSSGPLASFESAAPADNAHADAVNAPAIEATDAESLARSLCRLLVDREGFEGRELAAQGHAWVREAVIAQPTRELVERLQAEGMRVGATGRDSRHHAP